MNFSREVKQDAQNPSHFWLTLGTNITDKQKDAVVINLSLENLSYQPMKIILIY